jgi:autotransporter translocation and assembly factor TamB
MWDLVKVLLTIVSVVLLLLVLGLGFLIPFERVHPNLHGMIAFLAGLLSIGIHIRVGTGPDYTAK